MSTIITRETGGTAKGTPLTNAEIDNNFINLNNDKLEASSKDVSGGIPGLTLFKLNLKNAAGTITSWFSSAATVARTWIMPDKDGTVAMTSDITGGTSTGSFTTLSATGIISTSTTAIKAGGSASGLGGLFYSRKDTGADAWASGVLGSAAAVNWSVYDVVTPKEVFTITPNASYMALNPVGLSIVGTITGSNLSGTNTGDNATNTLYSGLVTNATHTGDVTGSAALTIAANAVTNAKAAQMAVNTIKGRITAGTGNAEDLTAANVRTIVTDASNRFVTDAEKTAWDAKGDVTLAGVQTLTNKTFTGYTETVYALAGTDIDVVNGTIQTKTLAANTTFTESLADGQSVILGITAGTYSVTWPSVTWAKVGGSGVAPILTSTGVNWIILWQTGGVLRGSFMGTA